MDGTDDKVQLRQGKDLLCGRTVHMGNAKFQTKPEVQPALEHGDGLAELGYCGRPVVAVHAPAVLVHQVAVIGDAKLSQTRRHGGIRHPGQGHVSVRREDAVRMIIRKKHG